VPHRRSRSATTSSSAWYIRARVPTRRSTSCGTRVVFRPAYMNGRASRTRSGRAVRDRRAALLRSHCGTGTASSRCTPATTAIETLSVPRAQIGATRSRPHADTLASLLLRHLPRRVARPPRHRLLSADRRLGQVCSMLEVASPARLRGSACASSRRRRSRPLIDLARP